MLTDGTNTETIELGELDDGNTLEGKVLWPGASVAEDGVTPTGWPGWEKIGDAVGRDRRQLRLDARRHRGDLRGEPDDSPCRSPTREATPDCATGPEVQRDDGRRGGGAGLASTGFAGTTIAIVAGIIVIAGIAFLVVARIRRKRACIR